MDAEQKFTLPADNTGNQSVYKKRKSYGLISLILAVLSIVIVYTGFGTTILPIPYYIIVGSIFSILSIIFVVISFISRKSNTDVVFGIAGLILALFALKEYGFLIIIFIVMSGARF